MYVRGGIGRHLEYDASVSLEELESHREVKNRKLLRPLRENSQLAQHLMDACDKDVDLGQMDPGEHEALASTRMRMNTQTHARARAG